jgi:YD repeat-containing protein
MTIGLPTTPQGLKYSIDAHTGAILNVTNRVGNKLTFTDGAITSTSGLAVTIDRDPEGRIIAIIDPRGNRVRYSYEANGNLATFTDRDGNITQFVYRTDVAHYLQSIIDPLGRPAAQTTYYPDGRVKQVTDASGKTIQYSYDTGSLVQHVTDQLGNTTELDQDTNGNVTREVSPNGVVTLKQYNNLDLVTSETTVTPQGNLTTTNTYDAMGDLTSSSAPDGTTTRTYYDAYGEPTSTADAAGNATRNTFDSSGDLT